MAWAGVSDMLMVGYATKGSSSMDARLSEGLAHHQAGRWADADRCYPVVRSRDPRDADALHLLGVIAYQVNQPEPAIELISRAISLNPSAGLYYNNLGNALRRSGRREEASAAYERSVSLMPDYAEAHAN